MKSIPKDAASSSILSSLVDEIVQRGEGICQALLADFEAVAVVVAYFDQPVPSRLARAAAVEDGPATPALNRVGTRRGDGLFLAEEIEPFEDSNEDATLTRQNGGAAETRVQAYVWVSCTSWSQP